MKSIVPALAICIVRMIISAVYRVLRRQHRRVRAEYSESSEISTGAAAGSVNAQDFRTLRLVRLSAIRYKWHCITTSTRHPGRAVARFANHDRRRRGRTTQHLLVAYRPIPSAASLYGHRQMIQALAMACFRQRSPKASISTLVTTGAFRAGTDDGINGSHINSPYADDDEVATGRTLPCAMPSPGARWAKGRCHLRLNA